MKFHLKVRGRGEKGESSRDNEMKVIVGISAIEFLRPPLFVIHFHTTTADKFIQLITSNQETGKNLNTSFQLHY